MSRTSRVPYHQNVYDLLLIEPRRLAKATRQIRDWERRTGYRFPPALAELYTTEAAIPCGLDGTKLWVLPLVEVWHQYSNSEPPTSLGRVLQHRDRPERVGGSVESGTYFRVQVENQGCWLIYVRLSGEDDPPTYATDGGPFFLSLGRAASNAEWRRLGTFSEVLFAWFAFYYHGLLAEIEESFVPLLYMSHAAMRDEQEAPPKPYRNGLWLRTPAEPFAPPVIDFLTEQFGEPERAPREGDVTTFTWRPNGGTIRVTADHAAHPEPLSAWWVHATAPEQLAEFARILTPWGTLAQTLRADTEPARAVWNPARAGA